MAITYNLVTNIPNATTSLGNYIQDGGGEWYYNVGGKFLKLPTGAVPYGYAPTSNQWQPPTNLNVQGNIATADAPAQIWDYGNPTPRNWLEGDSILGSPGQPSPLGATSQSVTQTKDANGNFVVSQSLNAPNYAVGKVTTSQPVQQQVPVVSQTQPIQKTQQVQQPTQQTVQQAQPVQQQSYINANGAYFQQTANGLALVNDPNILRQLQSGAIPSTQQGLGSQQLTGMTAPSLIPEEARSATPEQGLQYVAQVMPELADNIMSSIGYSGSPEQFDSQYSTMAQSNPVQFVQDLYGKMLEQSGLPQIKTQYEEFIKKQEDLTNQMNDEILEINDNPWLVEGVRQRQIRKVQEKYAGRIDSATNSAKYLQSLYADGLTEARFMTQQALNIYNDQVDFEQQLYRDALQRQEDRIDAQTKMEFDLALQSIKGSGSTGVSNQSIDNERALLSQFRAEPIVKDYNTILAKKMSVDAIISSGVGGPGDLALVYEFMKGLDPTSVVRESEYASAAKSGNIFAGVFARFNGYLKEEGGFLPEQVKKAFQSIVDSKLETQRQLYDNVASEYAKIAERQGLNPSNVVLNYSAAQTEPASLGKGNMSSSDYVEKVLTNQGLSYQSVLNTVPSGYRGVIDNSTGEIGYIPAEEFNSQLYTAL